MRALRVFVLTALLIVALPNTAFADCIGFCPSPPSVGVGDGVLAVQYMTGQAGDAARTALAFQPTPVPYRWRLQTLCQIDDTTIGGCQGGQATCPVVPGRVITLYEVQRQRGVQVDRSPVDDLAPDPLKEVGQGYGGGGDEGRGTGG